MLWLKAFHIIFMVCWFAGIFYLPRLFVYHAMSSEAAVHRQLAIMERKLYRFVSIFAVLTVVLGFALMSLNIDAYLAAPWFHAKLAVVAALIIYHFSCGAMVKKMARGQIRHSHVFFRWFNESPLLFLLAIVILVVIKPI
jgi:putative membrane protein